MDLLADDRILRIDVCVFDKVGTIQYSLGKWRGAVEMRKTYVKLFSRTLLRLLVA